MKSLSYRQEGIQDNMSNHCELLEDHNYESPAIFAWIWFPRLGLAWRQNYRTDVGSVRIINSLPLGELRCDDR